MTKKAVVDWLVSESEAPKALIKRDFYRLAVHSTGSRMAVANKIARPKLYINYNNSSNDCSFSNRK